MSPDAAGGDVGSLASHRNIASGAPRKMLLEHELVPFEPTALLGERLLVLAPHPDDEVLGCGGLLALHAAAGRAVSVAVATDGTGAANAGDELEGYRARRERETIDGLAELGVSEPRFLRLPDRGLARETATLQAMLREILEAVRPDLVAAPSPVEMHPDHVALAAALLGLIRSDALPPGLEPGARVAFYEVSQPFRPNALVDISAVEGLKQKAAARHASQIDLKAYGRFARGLNEYRAMSLPPHVTAAEAYWCATAGELRAMADGALRDAMSPAWQLPASEGAAAAELRALRAELERRAGECAALSGLLDEHREAVAQQTKTINDLFGEIDRLNAIVESMRGSKRWKLHEAIGKLTGRG